MYGPESANGEIQNATNKLTESNINPVVVLIDFPSSESDSTKGKLNVNSIYPSSIITSIDSAFNGTSNSLKDYLSKVSGGKCLVNSYLAYNINNNVYVYTAEHTKEYYMPYDSATNPIGYKDYEQWDRTQLLVDAFAAIKSQIPSSLDLDANDDGYIDAVDFFVPYQTAWNTFLWPHKWSVKTDTERKTEVNGAILSGYNLITASYFNNSKYQVVTHEFMHTLGFPDMYVYASGTFTDPIGSWTMMANNTGYPTVRERIKYGGWVSESNIPTISKSGTYAVKGSTLDSTTNTIAYKVTVPNSSEYFMIEYRDRSSNIYEAEVPATGLIVYRVNPNRTGNSYGDPEIYVLRNANQGSYGAYLDGTTNHQSLDLTLSSGASTGYKVEYVSNTSGEAKFNLISNDISITSITSSLGTAMKIGNSTNLTVNATSTNGGLKYSLDVNGESLLKDSTSNTVSWTPTKTGTYTITATVTDSANNSITKTMTVNVTEPNKTVIYYKGYDNPYIHYQIGNGTWTTAPGVKMTASTDVSGYTYKAEIDLGDAEKLTACFNNGSGTWDSNNGSNYSFGVGYYTYSSGIITKIAKPEKLLQIDSFTATPADKTVSGNEVILKGQASNNTGDVQYKFSYKNNTTGESGTFRDYSSYNTLSWLTGTVGNYTLTLEAKDSKTTVKKEINFTVEAYKDLKINSVTSSAGDIIKSNTATTFTINTEGGYGNNSYNLSVNGVNLLSNSSSNTVAWTPTQAGTYTVSVTVASKNTIAVYDRTIKVEDNKTTIYYKGYDNPYIHYKIGNGTWTTAPGVKMTACQDVTGYYYKAEVDLGNATTLTACFNNGSGTWDSNNGNDYTFGSGYYTYSGGVITKIEKPSLISILSSAGDTIKTNTETTLSVNVQGGTNLGYTILVDGTKVLDNSTSNNVKWTPTKAGTYKISAVVTSGSETITAEKTITVKDVTSNITTIYYTGYNIPYIHYKIGNGSWTAVPGVKMIECQDILGYYYKAEIDLGDATTLTACFNNDLGSWDNNNGNNYTFGVGRYTFSSGVITKLSN